MKLQVTVLVLPCVMALLAGCSSSPAAKGPEAPAALPASQASRDASKLVGQKIKVTGVYVSSFSNGGRPGDTWVHLLSDAMSNPDTIGCVVPEAQKSVASSTKKATAEGTLSFKPGDRVLLEGCTFHPLP
jgi:hypothetical protein